MFSNQTRDIGFSQAGLSGAIRTVSERSPPPLFLAVTFDRITQHIKRRTMFLVGGSLKLRREGGRNREADVMIGRHEHVLWEYEVILIHRGDQQVQQAMRLLQYRLDFSGHQIDGLFVRGLLRKLRDLGEL